MPSWWGKSSSKDEKKKGNKESFIDAIHRKFRIASEEKSNNRSGGSRRRSNDAVSERGSLSRVPSRSPSPSTHVSRCQSFAERPRAQPLPLPVCTNNVSRTDSGISISTKPGCERGSKPFLFLPNPKPGCVPSGLVHTEAEADLATASVSSDSSIDSDDPSDSHLLSPLTSDYENGKQTATSSPLRKHKDQSPIVTHNSTESLTAADNLFNNQILSASPKRDPLNTHVQSLQIPPRVAFYGAVDSSMSSPSRSPISAFSQEQVLNSGLWTPKQYSDIALLGSGHCSSPGSGHNSGHNSVGGDMYGQMFWPQSRCSPECSPIPSPRMTSPGPSSRIHSGAVTPLHPRVAGATIESPASRPDDGKQSHRLPLPPLTISNTCPFSPSYSTVTSPSVPRSPGRTETPVSPGSRWKKGRLLGRGTFGHVYLGFNRESGEMCAMKEVTLFSDDVKSRESVQQLGQEIALLSRLRHPNIVQYYGSETVSSLFYFSLIADNVFFS
ncbi:LOW QUALITY PROTEIN: mitogen-activated protein kinase kinase kinase YODA-like [Carica papaya]|uniref:LOW QUALITY PROTEIN: mitogen-activated protein kinase kinase kinase YODA-like n=1 Tax=Carica papaya TaxID=3649 RepID=UPI000B8CF776|nr:LOW QUALITY PROTEIN: mitogen-activated protein kinase kinase kinase YODA-like [Carica papaya]